MYLQKASTSCKGGRQRRWSLSVAIDMLFGSRPVVRGGADGVTTSPCRRPRREYRQQHRFVSSLATIKEEPSLEGYPDNDEAVHGQGQQPQITVKVNMAMHSGSLTALAAFQGLPALEVHAPELPIRPCSSAIPSLTTQGLDSPAEASSEGAQVLGGMNALHALNILGGMKGIHTSKDLCGNSEANGSDALADADVAVYPIRACGSKESAMHLQCHMSTESSACQVHIDVYGTQAEHRSPRKKKPSLTEWAKMSLKRLEKMGRGVNNRILSCTATPKVKDCRTPEESPTLALS